MIYVLMFDGLPIDASEIFQRLSMEMAAYPADEQKLMSIHNIEVLE